MIDKEGKALVEDVRKALIQYGRQTGSSSVKKKTRKVTSQLIWSAEEYVDALDDIKATSKNETEMIERVRSLIRTAEEDALKSMTVTPDDTGHHLVQSRTGGDALTDISYERSGPIISRLSDKHQRTFGNTLGARGNLPPEMSLSNYAHKADDRATGLERESNIGKNPDKSTVAHNRGTAYYANMKGVDMSDDAAIEAALDNKVTEQINQGRIAAETDAPRQAALRELTGNDELYRGPVPKDLVLDKEDVLKSYEALNGSIRLNRKAMTALAAGGIAALGPLGTASSAAEVKGRTEIAAETDNFVDKAQAGIAGVSLAGDVASYNPITAIPGALISTGADALNVVIDGGRAMLQGTATYDRKQLERKEQLRAKPADAPERENALSVGFAGGM